MTKSPGLRTIDHRSRRLFSYPKVNAEPVETQHKAISPYLFDAGGLNDPHTVVKEVPRSINGLKSAKSGTQPIEDGLLIFDVDRRKQLAAIEPNAVKFLRPFVGTTEFLYSEKRWIMVLHGVDPTELKPLKYVRELLGKVRDFRSISRRTSTLALADYPSRFNVEVFPKRSFLIVPEVSSEKRQYAPVGFFKPPTIPSNLVKVIENASLADFAFLSSAIHMAWLRHVGGRLESRYRYSIGLVYNTFPLPPDAEGGTAPALKKLEPLAQAILDARAAHPGATLATLYDPDLMPANLRKAHTDLDRAVDRLYRPAGFASDRERVEHLFSLYEKMVTPLLAAPKKRGRKS